jgi:hypothetical protein
MHPGHVVLNAGCRFQQKPKSPQARRLCCAMLRCPALTRQHATLPVRRGNDSVRGTAVVCSVQGLSTVMKCVMYTHDVHGSHAGQRRPVQS